MNTTASRPVEDITLLDLDHPGANDPAYKARRNDIARLARNFHAHGGEVPDVAYTEEEHGTWYTAVSRLAPLQQKRASSLYLKARKNLEIPVDRIPQLRELNMKLADRGGFSLEPVEGLIDARSFLRRLKDGTMLCTQYIRHASRPEYTPEPDVVHEVIGHVPMFTDPEFAAFTRRVGAFADVLSGDKLVALGRLYWFTIEFGLIEEQGELKAFGAGLLSSFGEIEHCFSPEVERRPFSVRNVIETEYSFSDMQPVLFVIPSFAHLLKETEHFLLANDNS